MKVKRRKTNKVEGDNEEVFIRLGDVPLDILRFNISMQSGAERKETRKSLLLKMGAKKPKNKYINYKELMQDRAKAKREAEMYTVERCANFVNKKLPLKQAKKKGKDKGRDKLKKRISKCPRRR
ncbi:hypothetical protein KSF78_0001805 [Schistosoma japonicum]|nr:hypothetical protein KSF78_0001805 [Schistosoma japonicum]